MKLPELLIITSLIFMLIACSSTMATTMIPIPDITASPILTFYPTPTFTPVIEATKVTKVAYLTIVDDSIKKFLNDEKVVDIGHKAGSYFPKKEGDNWIFKDDYNQVTSIKNINVMGSETTFEIYRQGGKTNKITASTGSIVLLDFTAPGRKRGYVLFFAPSVNEFVYCHNEYFVCDESLPPICIDPATTKGYKEYVMCDDLKYLICRTFLPGSDEYKGCMSDTMYTPVPCEKPCFLQTSSIRLIVWDNGGSITKNFDENDSSWCTKSNPLVGTGFEFNPYYTTFYVLPGDETIYHWSEGNCPKVTIEEIKN
jgi:hypothetical protein